MDYKTYFEGRYWKTAEDWNKFKKYKFALEGIFRLDIYWISFEFSMYIREAQKSVKPLCLEFFSFNIYYTLILFVICCLNSSCYRDI